MSLTGRGMNKKIGYRQRDAEELLPGDLVLYLPSIPGLIGRLECQALNEL